MRLENKVALVSGGASGIGAATARLLAKEGAKVVIGDLDETGGHRVEEDIKQAGGAALFVTLDVTNADQWQRAVETATSRFGGLHVLVNNAGVFRRGTVEDEDEEQWDFTMSVNAKGVFLGTKAAIPAMRAGGGGSIVNLSSIAGLVGGIRSTSYNASKGAVRLLTKSTAFQYAREGIRCNSVHPAPIETPILDWVHPDDHGRPDREEEIPMGRFGRPEEVAYGILFLACDESSYMTGSELVMDGGLTAR